MNERRRIKEERKDRKAEKLKKKTQLGSIIFQTLTA